MATTEFHAPPPKSDKPFYQRMLTNLTFWVLIAIIAGVLVGHFFPVKEYPGTAFFIHRISDRFIDVIKLFIPPIIFLTIVLGISGMGDMKKVGRIGVKALLYFEIVTTFALVIGIAVAYFIQPGNIDRSKLTVGKSALTKAAETTTKEFSWLEFFTNNLTIQVLILAIIVGIVLNYHRKREVAVKHLSTASKYVFTGLRYVMYFAPVGAFAGMAYTISKYGLHTLIPLGKLMGTVYITMFLFIFVILGSILWFYRLSIWRLLKHIKEEILLVLGTSSSETALPSLMHKLEGIGCSKSVVGLVVPTGYSFNLDGTSIYLSMSVIFLAQLYGVHLSMGEMLSIIGILMVTSKGAAGVTGSGFVVLASTLTALHKIPTEGLAFLFGVDKFMSEARSITNLIGNTVATIVISKSEKELDNPKF